MTAEITDFSKATKEELEIYRKSLLHQLNKRIYTCLSPEDLFKTTVYQKYLQVDSYLFKIFNI